MKQFTIPKNGETSLLKFLQKTARNMPDNAVYKALRKGRVRVNGVRAKDGKMRLNENDKIELYINDEFFAPIQTPWKALKTAELTVVYEDENILIVNKPQGLLCHDDEHENVHTLINIATKYIIDKGETQLPALCHRLDRNTQGLVIIAKNAVALAEMNGLIKTRQVRKFYICEVFGAPPNDEGALQAYLTRDKLKKQVYVSDKSAQNSKEIITKYKIIERRAETSILEIELITGRTHQIRAHMAHIGCPIVGDGKYGNNAKNKEFGKKYQTLCAYKLMFNENIEGFFSYLSNKQFSI